MARRKFLFLQGVATPFFKKLSIAISDMGHETYRVNFCGGDRLFSLGIKNWRFNQPVENLPSWLEEKHNSHGFTDAVLFGDTRPAHVQAIQFLRSKGVRIHVFEEGYLRPNWITLEENGVNGHSSILAKPSSFWANLASEDEELPTQSIGKTFTQRALFDISYRLCNGLLSPLFHHYQSHRPINALLEYAGWAKRMPLIKLRHSHKNQRQIDNLVASKKPFYLLPLQLDSDAQIRVHSPYNNVEHAIRTVMESFARYAPNGSQLVIKNHPLATGLVNHQQQVSDIGQELGLQDRIVFLESGHLPTLLQHTRGTVLVNSTTGTSALFHGSPVCALGTAIFDLPGLTFQHGLDRFWKEGEPADKTLYRNFRHTVIRETQINGDFYSRKGMELAVAGSLQRMSITHIPTEAPDSTPDVLPELIPAPAYGGQLPEKSYLYKKH